MLSYLAIRGESENVMGKIISASFVSEWDGGTQIITSCKVNLDTKEVFNIQSVDCNVNNLEEEYIIINDEKFPVLQKSDITENSDEYWYE